MIRFLHTGDWHPRSMGTIGGKLSIDPATGLSFSLTDFQDSLDFMALTIVNENIKLVLIAGDVFDSNKPTMDELRVVMSFLAFLSEKNIPVVMIPGNHDISQSSQMASSLAPLTFLPIHILERPGSVVLEIDGEIVKIDCLPYPSRGRLLAQLVDKKNQTPEELTALINQGLLSILQALSLNPDTELSKPTKRILLAHGSVESAVVGEQPRTLAHDVFIPVRDVEGHYDYVALGHIHQTQAVSDRGMYSGSLLRQSFGEEKERKGFLIGEFAQGGVKTTHVTNPYCRTYQTLSSDQLDPIPTDKRVVYRIKDSVPEDALPLLMPIIHKFTESLPFVQVDISVIKEDRTRDAQLNNSLSSYEALERCLERDGIQEPSLSLCRHLHLQLCEEATK